VSITPFTAGAALTLPDCRVGKVRESYALSGDRRLLVVTDRLSAFDRILGGMAYKGQILNELAAWWFTELADITPHHLLAVPDPNASIVQSVQPFPVEVIVRGYMTGVTSTALWTRYAAGERDIYGYHFPEGLSKNVQLNQPIITPTTKAGPGGHDERLTCEEVVSQGWLDSKTWRIVQDRALALFERGQKIAQERGLLLVDTKYEFGSTADGEILLIDEVHTPDSSRYWSVENYKAALEDGRAPEHFDKEWLRLAYVEAGYRGEGEPPLLPQAIWDAMAARYIRVYEQLTQKDFVCGAYPVEDRLRSLVMD